MCSLNKKWIYTVIGLLLIGAGIFCIGILQTRKTDALRDDPIYGDWKVTRIVTYEPLSCYGHQYLGSELGRTISITPDSISDSRLLEEAKSLGQVIYEFEYDDYDRYKWDLSDREEVRRFQLKHQLIIWMTGFSINEIYEYTFYAKATPPDSYIMDKFDILMFEQNHTYYLLANFPLGYYILEREKTQKSKDISGEWMIDYLVSEKEGIVRPNLDFLEEYGKIYTFETGKTAENGKKFQASYVTHRENRVEYEQENHIPDGLGIKNREITWIEVKSDEQDALRIIPINRREALIGVRERWYHARKFEQKKEYDLSPDNYFQDCWKPVQLLYIEDKGKQWTNWMDWLYDEPLQPYGIQFYGSIFNELKMYRYTVPQMEEQMIIPPNVQMMLDTDKSYWVAYQYIDRYLEIRDSWMKFIIILDEQTMICEYDGLWYLVEKSDVNMKEMVDYTV